MLRTRWMARAIAFIGVFLFVPLASATDTRALPTISSTDIRQFWEAFDAAVKVDDPTRQRDIVQRLYIDKGTVGLHAFMEAKGYTAQSYVDAIRSYPRYWASIRPHTLKAQSAIAALQPELVKFKAIYPELRPASIYLAIGALKSGGTTQGDKVLIGAELATGDETVDISEMTPKMQAWLTGYFRSKPFDNMVLLTVHEFVHTQEHGTAQNLLGQAVYEGAADFVAEKVTGGKPQLAYFDYGPKNEKAIKAAFAEDMAGEDTSGWLYNNTNNAFGVRDLGYYVGYAICNAYYQQAADKRAAIRQMIELDFSDKNAVNAFVETSRYFL